MTEVDLPWRITVREPSKLFPETWKHLGGNCLGEFQVSILLKRVPNSLQAAEGWDGDRYEVYENSDGKLGLLWLSIWDSNQDALQFVRAMERYAEIQQQVDLFQIQCDDLEFESLSAWTPRVPRMSSCELGLLRKRSKNSHRSKSFRDFVFLVVDGSRIRAAMV